MRTNVLAADAFALMRTLLAYSAIWALFLAVAPARAVVRSQFRALLAPSTLRLIGSGALVGVLLVVINVGVLLWCGAYAVKSGWSPELRASLFTVGYVAIVAVTEEMMVRGLLLTRLREVSTARVAVVSTAGVFAVMHIGRSDFSWFTALQYLTDGLLLGWIAIATGSIWAGVGFHFVKNLGVALFFGIRLPVFDPWLSERGGETSIDKTADVVAYSVAIAVAVVMFRQREARRR